MARRCKGSRDDGGPCGTAPLREEDFCLWHSPNHTEEAAEARRRGGLRRRRELAIAGVYDLEGASTIEQILRLLDIAIFDTLALENSVARAHALASLLRVALKARAAGELDERIKALEAAIGPRLIRRA